jgi:hypothetical protein
MDGSKLEVIALEHAPSIPIGPETGFGGIFRMMSSKPDCWPGTISSLPGVGHFSIVFCFKVSVGILEFTCNELRGNEMVRVRLAIRRCMGRKEIGSRQCSRLHRIFVLSPRSSF